MINTEEKMLKEYKVEMERHQQAMRKYIPDYDTEYDRRLRCDKNDV